MKKAIVFLLTLVLWGCSAGDLQLERIDFQDAPVAFCGTLTTQTPLLFKINGSEALILEPGSGLLVNEVSEGERSSAIPGGSGLTYRIFSGSVDAGYFCDLVPPAEPTVLEDVIAEEGEVRVSTVRDPNDSTRFLHTIRLAGVSFVNEQGERLTNLTVEDFGEVSTTTTN